MAADAPQSPEPSPLSWTVTPETNGWLHLLAYGLLAPLGAVGLALVGGGVVVSAVLLAEGSWGPVLLLAVAVAFALARPPVLAVLADDATETSLGYEGWEPSPAGLLAASTLCGVALLAVSLHSRAAAAAVAALSFAGGLLAVALQTDARIDCDRRLETRAASVDLAALSGVRSLEVGGVTVFLLGYARGADGFGNPRVVAAPRESAAAVREALEAGVAAAADADPIGRAERAVVALFGLGVLATGPALAVVVRDAGSDAAVVTAYAGALSTVFAGPMLWYAWKG
jgi:hypothetical protein